MRPYKGLPLSQQLGEFVPADLTAPYGGGWSSEALLLVKVGMRSSGTTSDLQGVMPVQGKGEEAAGDLPSMTGVLPPNRGVFALPEGWGRRGRERESGQGRRGRMGHLSWAQPGLSDAVSDPCERPQSLQTAKNKIHSGIFSEEETETENKILALGEHLSFCV